jgi:hypothetical protein
MVKRVPNYQLVKLRIPAGYAFPMSKHIFDKQVMEKSVYTIKSINLKYADKFTPENGSMFARWIRPTEHEGELVGGFFTINFVACTKEDLSNIRKTLMKTYVPMMLDWMKDASHDEEWESDKHSFIVTHINGEFSVEQN